jgi:hypothetical protein
MPDTMPPIACLVVEVDPRTNQVQRSYWEDYDGAMLRWFRQREIAEPKSLISDTQFSQKLDPAD